MANEDCVVCERLTNNKIVIEWKLWHSYSGPHLATVLIEMPVCRVCETQGVGYADCVNKIMAARVCVDAKSIYGDLGVVPIFDRMRESVGEDLARLKKQING
jgi:hypothetical protein